MNYLVICRADVIFDGTSGPYVLATRQVFPTREQAAEYAATIAHSREPIVVEGRFHQLRVPYFQDRIGRCDACGFEVPFDTAAGLAHCGDLTCPDCPAPLQGKPAGQIRATDQLAFWEDVGSDGSRFERVTEFDCGTTGCFHSTPDEAANCEIGR